MTTQIFNLESQGYGVSTTQDPEDIVSKLLWDLTLQRKMS